MSVLAAPAESDVADVIAAAGGGVWPVEADDVLSPPPQADRPSARRIRPLAAAGRSVLRVTRDMGRQYGEVRATVRRTVAERYRAL